MTLVSQRAFKAAKRLELLAQAQLPGRMINWNGFRPGIIVRSKVAVAMREKQSIPSDSTVFRLKLRATLVPNAETMAF